MSKKNSLGLVVAALVLALGLANSASATVYPYAADAHTLHLWHFDEASGNVIDYGNSATKINLWPNNAPSQGASTYTGLGYSLNVAQAGAAKGGGVIGAGTGQGSTPLTYGNAEFMGADKSFTYEVNIRLNSITTQLYNGNSQSMILGHDGGNGSRNFDLKQYGANTIMFASNPDVGADQVSMTIPTSGANAWTATDWFNVAVTYNGTTKLASMYWTKLTDTVTTANLVTTKTLQDDPMMGVNYFTVGAGARSWSSRYIDGYIDEVRICDTVLTASQLINTIPEPSTVSLLGFAALGLFASAWRRFRA